jgi:hypothetical protein
MPLKVAISASNIAENGPEVSMIYVPVRTEEFVIPALTATALNVAVDGMETEAV